MALVGHPQGLHDTVLGHPADHGDLEQAVDHKRTEKRNRQEDHTFRQLPFFIEGSPDIGQSCSPVRQAGPHHFPDVHRLQSPCIYGQTIIPFDVRAQNAKLPGKRFHLVIALPAFVKFEIYKCTVCPVIQCGAYEDLPHIPQKLRHFLRHFLYDPAQGKDFFVQHDPGSQFRRHSQVLQGLDIRGDLMLLPGINALDHVPAHHLQIPGVRIHKLDGKRLLDGLADRLHSRLFQSIPSSRRVLFKLFKPFRVPSGAVMPVPVLGPGVLPGGMPPAFKEPAHPGQEGRRQKDACQQRQGLLFVISEIRKGNVNAVFHDHSPSLSFKSLPSSIWRIRSQLTARLSLCVTIIIVWLYFLQLFFNSPITSTVVLESRFPVGSSVICTPSPSCLENTGFSGIHICVMCTLSQSPPDSPKSRRYPCR